MFGLGMGELVVILIVALIFLGPNKLPEAAKAIGRGIRELRRHTRDLEQTIEQDEELGSTVRELKSALRGDPAPPVRPAPMPPPAARDLPPAPPPMPVDEGPRASEDDPTAKEKP